MKKAKPDLQNHNWSIIKPINSSGKFFYVHIFHMKTLNVAKMRSVCRMLGRRRYCWPKGSILRVTRPFKRFGIVNCSKGCSLRRVVELLRRPLSSNFHTEFKIMIFSNLYKISKGFLFVVYNSDCTICNITVISFDFASNQ